MKNHTKYAALATTILLTSALAGPAKAETPSTEPLEKVPTQTSQLAVVVKAESTSLISFEKPAVSTTPAPVVVEPVAAPVVQTPTGPAKLEVAYNSSGEVKSTTAVPVAPAVATAPASGKGATIAAAAYAQLGVAQDCTRLATNALAAVGINHHGWPASYAALGTQVSVPAPGDILIYADAGAGVAHVAIYVGNGQAIHGGFNGSTVLFSANVGSGYAAYRVA